MKNKWKRRRRVVIIINEKRWISRKFIWKSSTPFYEHVLVLNHISLCSVAADGNILLSIQFCANRILLEIFLHFYKKKYNNNLIIYAVMVYDKQAEQNIIFCYMVNIHIYLWVRIIIFKWNDMLWQSQKCVWNFDVHICQQPGNFQKAEP